MRTSRTLVVFYSRLGTTAKLAEAIAQATGADVERLTDTVNRQGVVGFVRSIYDAAFRRETKLDPILVDPTAYDLVIVGTPDWGRSVSSPVRTFLSTYQGRLPQVAFFLTDGAGDHAAVFRDMTALAGREPVARLGVAHDDVEAGRYLDQVAFFVRALPAPAQKVPLTVPPPHGETEHVLHH